MSIYTKKIEWYINLMKKFLAVLYLIIEIFTFLIYLLMFGAPLYLFTEGFNIVYVISSGIFGAMIPLLLYAGLILSVLINAIIATIKYIKGKPITIINYISLLITLILQAYLLFSFTKN